MADYGASDTSTTVLGANQFPISEVYVPNDALRALEGGPVSTDTGGKKSSPASMYIKDGGDVTQGASTDANTVASVMGRLTKIRDLLSATLTVGGTITEANSAAILADLAIIAGAVSAGKVLTTETNSAAMLADLAAIAGAIAANKMQVSGTFWQTTQPISAASLPLPSGAALEAGHLANLDTHTPALGQALAASSVPVVLTSIQQAALTPPPAITGFALETGGNLQTAVTRLTSIVSALAGTLTINGTVTETNSSSILADLATIATQTTSLATHTDATTLHTDLTTTNSDLSTINTTLGTLGTQSTLAAAKTDLDSIVTNTGNILAKGQATMANSAPVVLASDQAPLTSATATRTNVVAAATDTSLLASNTSRKGATFFNDSTATLYLAYGSGAASLTSYSVQIPANGFFELPPAPIFTGAIHGIWSAANGNARITELS